MRQGSRLFVSESHLVGRQICRHNGTLGQLPSNRLGRFTRAGRQVKDIKFRAMLISVDMHFVNHRYPGTVGVAVILRD